MMPAVNFGHAWRLSDLLTGFLDLEGPAGESQVSTLTLDSRAVLPGTLFCALQGARTHGLAFADEAAQRGATAIIAEPTTDWPLEAMTLLQARIRCPVFGLKGLPKRISAIASRFNGEPSDYMTVFGVTGANGKTSIAHYLAQALGDDTRCAVMDGLGNGFPDDYFQHPADTVADAISLQSTLGWLRAKGAAAVAMEVSSQAVARSWIDAVRFSFAIVTSVDSDPLETQRGLCSMPSLEWVIVNLDDPRVTQILGALAPSVRVAAYGLEQNTPIPERCDLWVRAIAVKTHPQGLELDIDTNLGAGQLTAALIGGFNASNLLAVLATLLTRGLSLERALDRLSQVRGVPGRMECFGGNGAPIVVVDCAHTPDALQKALTNLRLHQSRRVITVVGCGGDRDRGGRPLMGAIAERLSDALILTDDNPRNEDGDQIIADILSGLSHPDAARVQRERALAIRLAIALAGTGDAVLVAGKGQENTQDMGDLKVHFSDRAQVVEALREWREGHH